jgi:hypothetical protein
MDVYTPCNATKSALHYPKSHPIQFKQLKNTLKTHLLKLTHHTMNISSLFLFFDDLLLRIACWLQPDTNRPHWSDALVPLSEEDQALVQRSARHRQEKALASPPQLSPDEQAAVDAEWKIWEAKLDRLTPENQKLFRGELEDELLQQFYGEARRQVIARRKQKFLAREKGASDGH